MARFRYRMQNILDIKIKIEEQERIALGIAQAELLDEQKNLQDLMIRRADYERQLKELAQGTIRIADIKLCKRSIDAMKSKIRDQMIAVARAQKNVDAARRRLNEVMQERKMHESLKDKAFMEFLEEEKKAESKAIDELVSFTYGNSQEEEV